MVRIKYPTQNDSVPGQRQMMHNSVEWDRRIRRQVVEMMNDPLNPLTRAEITEMVHKRPDKYKALRPLID